MLINDLNVTQELLISLPRTSATYTCGGSASLRPGVMDDNVIVYMAIIAARTKVCTLITDSVTEIRR